MKHQNTDLGLSPLPYIRLIFSPWVMLGTALLIFWLLSRMTLLGWADLSYVLPVTSLGYVLNALGGKFFFGEEISWQRWAGTAAIVIGIVLVGMTAANTTAQTGSEPVP
jgi:drug/metabolite transporter (DMT)-like permease